MKQQNGEASEPIHILALSRQQRHHYAPLYGQSDFKITETDVWSAQVLYDIKPDILLTPSSDWYESIRCIEAAKELRIPSLLIMDGIIEWRHQWENPRFAAGDGAPYNQPALTDKIACLGWQSVRTLESWGNRGKCELVGAIRFDRYLEQPIIHQERRNKRRLLVMTANTPAFTPEQMSLVKQSLLDVKQALQSNKDWEVIWRVRKGLDEELELSDNFPELRGKPLYEVFGESDAVLSTPSTVLLEAMLVGLPTAILDYTNSPPYVNAAWMLTSPQHVGAVLEGLRNPTARRLSYQDEILHNALECYTAALPRLLELIRKMAMIGRQARSNNQALILPQRMIPIMPQEALPSQRFDLAELYPNHPILSNSNLNELQRQVIFAQQEITTLKRRLSERTIQSLLVRALRRLYAKIRKRQ